MHELSSDARRRIGGRRSETAESAWPHNPSPEPMGSWDETESLGENPESHLDHRPLEALVSGFRTARPVNVLSAQMIGEKWY
jgi:hypothetical protein